MEAGELMQQGRRSQRRRGCRTGPLLEEDSMMAREGTAVYCGSVVSALS